MTKDNEPNCLSDFFRVSLLASGTPAAYQKAVSTHRDFRKNTCSCSPAEAIEEGMICRPSLNMVRGSMETDFPAALKAVLLREKEICAGEPFGVRILVNCSSIDQIDALLGHRFVSEGLGRNFHAVTIHSPKKYSEDNENRELASTVDGERTDAQDAYEVIEKIDGGHFADNLPVIVFQVGMIGEGINVRSFNSVIVTTHSDRTAMQQVGRVLRNYILPTGESKIENGHANVYAFVENVVDLKRLVLNLQEFDLTADCYDWGRKIDVSTGSGAPGVENAAPGELNGFAWSEIDELDIMTVIAASEFKAAKAMRREFVRDNVDGCHDLLADFMEAMKNDPEYFKEFGLRNAAKGFDRAMFESAVAEKKARPADGLREKTENGGAREGKTKAETQIELTADMLVDSLVALKEYLDTHCDAADTVWRSDRKAVLDEVFGNETMTGFFSKAISDEFAERLAGKAKRPADRRYDTNVKEKQECQETSAQRQTAVVQTQTPANTSDSSGTGSGATLASRMSRWLTSLLRQ